MNTKFLFLISAIIIIFMVMFNLNISYASSSGDKISDVIDGADSFLKAGDGTSIDEIKLKNTSNLVYKILMVLAISIAVIISGILGIKFMIGSVEEKAQVKDQLIPFIVGCIVIFGAFTIWSIAVNIGNEFEKTSSTYDSKATCKHCGAKVGKQDYNKGTCPTCGGNI